MNWFKQVLHNPRSKPHKMNLQWPLSIAVDALREASRHPMPAQEPTYKLFILTDNELAFLARAVDQALVD